VIAVGRRTFDVPEWESWRAQATEEMRTVQASYRPGEKLALKDELYKVAMKFLLPLFHYKCAYCESFISSTQPGDVEHYRPKGRIKDSEGKVVRIRCGDADIEHPGYWWLCYEWTNLLPSCIDCNRRRRHGDEDAVAGKADWFPIAGTRATNPNDSLENEQALLLDPTDDAFDPHQEFEFMSDGKIAAKTPRAQVTCDLLGLNLREKLLEQRLLAYDNAIATFSQFVSVSISAVASGGGMSDAERRLRSRLNNMWEGREQYSAFARLALINGQRVLGARSIQIAFPLAVD